MAELPKPVMLVFDWDNTLVDTWPVIHDALNATFAYMGHETWTLQDTKNRVRKSLRDSFPGYFGDRWQEAADKFYQFFEERHLDKLSVLPGTEDLLKHLQQHGIDAAVVSNKRGDLLRREATHLGFDKYFHLVSGANDAAKDKPDPVVIDHVLTGLPHQKGRDIWFIGDTAIDMECARNAGLTAIAIAAGSEQEKEFAAMPPDRFFADLHQLREYLVG